MVTAIEIETKTEGQQEVSLSFPEHQGILERMEEFRGGLKSSWSVNDFRKDATQLLPPILFAKTLITFKYSLLADGEEREIEVYGFEYKGESLEKTIDGKIPILARQAAEYQHANSTCPVEPRIAIPCLVDAGVGLTIGLWETMDSDDHNEAAQKTFDLINRTYEELFLGNSNLTRGLGIPQRETTLREMFFYELDRYAREAAES